MAIRVWLRANLRVTEQEYNENCIDWKLAATVAVANVTNKAFSLSNPAVNTLGRNTGASILHNSLGLAFGPIRSDGSDNFSYKWHMNQIILSFAANFFFNLLQHRLKEISKNDIFVISSLFGLEGIGPSKNRSGPL